MLCAHPDLFYIVVVLMDFFLFSFLKKGFDVGLLFGNLLLGYFSQDGHATPEDDREQYKQWLLSLLSEIWDQFSSLFISLWEEAENNNSSKPVKSARFDKERELLRLLQNTLGFAGCAMVRRIVGVAHALELDTVPNVDIRAKCERKALEMGKSLIKSASALSSVDQVMKMAARINAEM